MQHAASGCRVPVSQCGFLYQNCLFYSRGYLYHQLLLGCQFDTEDEICGWKFIYESGCWYRMSVGVWWSVDSGDPMEF